MVFAPVAAPEPLPVRGPFAALTIDAQRRRVFAAGALSLAVLDADTGKLVATIKIGGTRSLAVEPLGGHVFAGTGDGHISEIDPDRKTIVRSLDAGGAVDVLSYDSATGRIYADGGGRGAISVFDARSFAGDPPLAIPERASPPSSSPIRLRANSTRRSPTALRSRSSTRCAERCGRRFRRRA